MKKRYQFTAYIYGMFACHGLYVFDVLKWLFGSFGGKKHNNAFFWKKKKKKHSKTKKQKQKQKQKKKKKKKQTVYNQIFNRLIVWMWPAWCTRLKNTQKVEIAEETELLRISQKSRFPKIDFRFWKLYEASSWHQKYVFFGLGAQGYTLQSKFGPFCNRKFPPISLTSGLKFE